MSPLWIVATPIGNIDDLSPRARTALMEADLLLAEDTRRTGLLLSRYGIKAKKLLSFHDHNEAERQAEVLALLESGKNVALVSDAGTPLLADPGYRLVRECHKNNYKVSPVPGPSAPVAALSAAGLPPLPFTFLGFLPRSVSGRKDLFSAYAAVPGSLVFFERKDRLAESLALAYGILGPRELAICRELTKTYEEFILGRLEAGAEYAEGLLGELTIIIGPPEKETRIPEEEAIKILLAFLDKGLKARKAAREAARLCPGWSVGELYDLAVATREACVDEEMDEK